MSWVDKAHRKNQVHKLVEQAMNSKEFKDARKEDMEQSVLKAFCRFCFVGCEYMELKHGYKKKGLENFLKFAKGRIEEIGDDEKYLMEVIDYYKENYDLDVATTLGVEINRED